MVNDRIGFIGGGNMTRAIAGGLIAAGHDASALMIAEPSAGQRATLQAELPDSMVSAGNAEIASQSDILVLAVKPQLLATVCQELQTIVQQQRPLIISIAAGVCSGDIDGWLGGGLAIARVMPNQPALLRLGVSGVFLNEQASAADRARTETVMAAVGLVVHVAEESDIDTITAISGSGPAYFFLLIDILANMAQQFGLDEPAARSLARETAHGAAALALASDESMAALISRVRSPGGTTAAALDSLEQQNVRDIFEQAITAARDRAVALANRTHSDQ